MISPFSVFRTIASVHLQKEGIQFEPSPPRVKNNKPLIVLPMAGATLKEIAWGHFLGSAEGGGLLGIWMNPNNVSLFAAFISE